MGVQNNSSTSHLIKSFYTTLNQLTHIQGYEQGDVCLMQVGEQKIFISFIHTLAHAHVVNLAF